ncbi:family 1 encapsulin nanocompartment shell protein [Paracoccus aminophilus]|uniref:Linocin M18 bacteriocin protein n=1 Tax=Paracoccus aminophilus JCM 7686 TaxID=1367847 RepID=S5YX54_PARAH|nr:family 1 encapsulin nanocompartment shell protein [Paracoccus aminophilus]AGT09801.1 linocin M18 bacteriocin protein [Paracoccus aminophilus JCM 7686]
MNNLHRELAPISLEAWAQIDAEAKRTLKRYLGARRVVDVHGPKGLDFSAVGTGHIKAIPELVPGVHSRQRVVDPLVEFRIPFDLTRAAIDDVARGSEDSDWQPLKDAARKIALAEDRLVFEGYAKAGINGILPQSSNPVLTLPAKVGEYPEIVSRALNELRLAGVNGPYGLVLGTKPFEKARGGDDEGYPVIKHLEELLDRPIVWSEGIEGGALVTLRGGDFDLYLGQDLSIGYQSHTNEMVTLYLYETLTFQMQTTEAVVVLRARGA